MDRAFDWQPRFDERSRGFSIRATLETRPRERNKLWRVGEILDQGREGACVGFGWAAEAFSTPVVARLDRMVASVPQTGNAFALSLYRAAKLLDEWDGEDYSGTSVLAGAKAMQAVGLVKEYRWAFSLEDVIDAVIARGPVVMGIYWYSSMYKPLDGVLQVSGKVVGGHCITAVGYKMSSEKLGGQPSVILQNSWGDDWGINGLAEISLPDLRALLDNQAEACVPYKRSYGRK